MTASGISDIDEVAVDPSFEADVDLELAELGGAPVDVLAEFVAGGRLAGELHLATKRVAGLAEGHVVAAESGHASGFEPGRAAARDEHALALADHGDLVVAVAELLAGADVDHAPELHERSRRAADATLVAAEAGAHVAGAALLRLPHDLGVGDGSANHGDHVGVAACDEGVGFLQREDAPHDEAGLGQGAAGGGAPGELVLVLLVHAADESVEVEVARSGDAEEVDEAGRLEVECDLLAVLWLEPAGNALAAAEAGADDEVGAGRFADGGGHLLAEAAAVLGAAAVPVGAPVRRRREELHDEEAVPVVHLDAVEAALLGAAGGGGVGRDGLVDHRLGHLQGDVALALGHAQMAHAGNGGGGPGWAAVGGRGVGANVDELLHHHHAVAVGGFGEALVARNHGVGVGGHAPEAGDGMHRGRLEDAHGDTAAGARLVVGDEVIVDLAAAETGAVGGAHDAIAELGLVDGDGAEDVIEGHGWPPALWRAESTRAPATSERYRLMGAPRMTSGTSPPAARMASAMASASPWLLTTRSATARASERMGRSYVPWKWGIT